MKRSEVNSKIQEYILDYSDYDDNPNLEEAANNILDYLEKIGMKAPEHPNSCRRGCCSPEYEWEDE